MYPAACVTTSSPTPNRRISGSVSAMPTTTSTMEYAIVSVSDWSSTWLAWAIFLAPTAREIIDRIPASKPIRAVISSIRKVCATPRPAIAWNPMRPAHIRSAS